MNEKKTVKTYEYSGQNVTLCKKCGKQIFFIKTKKGKFMPIEVLSLECHFANCPGADGFRRK